MTLIPRDQPNQHNNWQELDANIHANISQENARNQINPNLRQFSKCSKIAIELFALSYLATKLWESGQTKSSSSYTSEAESSSVDYTVFMIGFIVWGIFLELSQSDHAIPKGKQDANRDNFPKELRTYFKQNSPACDEKQLANFFHSHDSVREAFIAWAKEHQSVVEHTRLCRALDIAEDRGVDASDVCRFINKIYQKICQEKEVNTEIIDRILHNEGEVGISLLARFTEERYPPKRYGIQALTLYEIGVIDEKELKKNIFCYVSRYCYMVQSFFSVGNFYFRKARYSGYRSSAFYSS